MEKLTVFKAQIPETGLEELRKNKYVPGVYSALDLKMNPFWEWLTLSLPLWMAPNLVTLIGFLGLASQVLVFALNDPSLQLEQPRWAYLYSAVAIFFNQTMDAMDGKQARRLKKSTPLGQLFDHGCDCIGVTFLLYSVFAACRTGEDLWLCFEALYTGAVLFYAANWSEYHTHVLVTSNGVFGVTEVQLAICALNLLSALFGPDIFHYQILGQLKRPHDLPVGDPPVRLRRTFQLVDDHVRFV